MKKSWYFLPFVFVFLHAGVAFAQSTSDQSVYAEKPEDPEAVYFTPDQFRIVADGAMDVSEQIQSAIDKVKSEKNFGILFIPEGTYRISRTIYIPPAIRLIGYGKKRPVFVLGTNTPGYQEAVPGDRGRANYMFWFTGNRVTGDHEPRDANAGTFYSAISNIDFIIGKGNPNAVALRTHYAQHCFINHSVINIGEGKAGIFDVGNELENVRFIGGDYGIYTHRTAPGWPMLIIDACFEGQRKAAIRTWQGGLAIVNTQIKKAPVAVEMAEGVSDRIYLEKCLLEDVRRAAIVVSIENNSMCQVNLVDVACRNVPVPVENLQSGNRMDAPAKNYMIREFTYGLVMDDLSDDSKFRTLSDMVPLSSRLARMHRMIPSLPGMNTWVNIRDLGAKGDGETDDTEIFRAAIAKYRDIYVPQGWYRITGTLELQSGTRLIGLHPFATQLVLKESEPAFSGFGSPVPMVESSRGGDAQLNGIGLNTGAYNYRAVACKWRAGERSMLNDIKFVGGHGTLWKPVPGEENPRRMWWRRRNPEISSPSNPVYERGKDLAWDNQYWSLWVTDGGGGFLKDIWSANTYAAGGLYVSHTDTPGRIFAMSIEHHVRNEARFSHVSHWKMVAFQFEEEGVEGKDCLMMDISDSHDLLFANLWMYRTIRVSTPQPVGVRLSGCSQVRFRNLHNYTQKLQVTEFPVFELNKDLVVYPWDFAKLTVTGEEVSRRNIPTEPWKPVRLATGFIFGTGLTSDRKGNVYFAEHDRKRIYSVSASDGSIRLLADFPWKPFTLATDTKDHLLVVCRYDPQPGYLIGGVQEQVQTLKDDNPSYSGWGNTGWAARAYSIDPSFPDSTFHPLEKVPSGEIPRVAKAIYPSSRWRSDFDSAIVFVPDSMFVAPDGVTIIPETYDLGRSAALSEAFPGKPFYVSKEINKTVVRLEVAENGTLSGPHEIIPRGEYSIAAGPDGNLYVADGQIFVYDGDFREMRRISLDERPISMAFGGMDGKTLFVTTDYSLYGIRIP